jgi:hypothetical protein
MIRYRTLRYKPVIYGFGLGMSAVTDYIEIV